MESVGEDFDALNEFSKFYNKEILDCPLCNLSFVKSDHLTQHLGIFHQNWKLYKVVSSNDIEGSEPEDCEILEEAENSLAYNDIEGSEPEDCEILAVENSLAYNDIEGSEPEDCEILEVENSLKNLNSSVDNVLTKDNQVVDEERSITFNREKSHSRNCKTKVPVCDKSVCISDSEDEEVDIETVDDSNSYSLEGRAEIFQTTPEIGDSLNKSNIRSVSCEDVNDIDNTSECDIQDAGSDSYEDINQDSSVSKIFPISGNNERLSLFQSLSSEKFDIGGNDLAVHKLQQASTTKSNTVKKDRNKKIIIASLPCNRDWLNQDDGCVPVSVPERNSKVDNTEVFSVHNELVESSACGERTNIVVENSRAFQSDADVEIFDSEDFGTNDLSNTSEQGLTRRLRNNFKSNHNDEKVSQKDKCIESLDSNETVDSYYQEEYPLLKDACHKNLPPISLSENVYSNDHVREDISLLDESVVCYEDLPGSQFSEENFDGFIQQNSDVYPIEKSNTCEKSSDRASFGKGNGDVIEQRKDCDYLINELDVSNENSSSHILCQENDDPVAQLKIVDVYALDKWEDFHENSSTGSVTLCEETVGNSAQVAVKELSPIKKLKAHHKNSLRDRVYEESKFSSVEHEDLDCLSNKDVLTNGCCNENLDGVIHRSSIFENKDYQESANTTIQYKNKHIRHLLKRNNFHGNLSREQCCVGVSQKASIQEDNPNAVSFTNRVGCNCSNCQKNLTDCCSFVNQRYGKFCLKPFKCSQCFFACSKKENLVLHVRRCFRKRRLRGLKELNRYGRKMVKSGSEIQPINCFVCHKEVQNKFKLVQHLFRLHADIVNSKSVKAEIVSILNISGDTNFPEIPSNGTQILKISGDSNSDISMNVTQILNISDHNFPDVPMNETQIVNNSGDSNTHDMSMNGIQNINTADLSTEEPQAQFHKTQVISSYIKFQHSENDTKFSEKQQTVTIEKEKGRMENLECDTTFRKEIGKSFSCSLCNCKFRSVYHLSYHRLTKHPGEFNPRNISGLVQNAKNESRINVETRSVKKLLKLNSFISRKKNVYSCSKCSKTFKYKRNFLRHVNVHDVKSQNCIFCGKWFPEIYLKLHVLNCIKEVCVREPGMNENFKGLVHNRKKEKMLKKNSKGNEQMLFNITKYNCNENDKYNCPICLKSYSRNFLYRHLFIHTPFKPYECKVCKRGFMKKSSLRTHIKNTCHNKEPDISNEVSQIESAVDTQHRKLSSGDTLKCVWCYRIFGNRADLRYHTLSCRNKISIKSTNIGIEVGNSVNETISNELQKEVPSEDYPSTQIKSYRCGWCEREFRSYYYLYSHKLVKHLNTSISKKKISSLTRGKRKILIPVNERKKNICNICGKLFQRREILELHYFECSQTEKMAKPDNVNNLGKNYSSLLKKTVPLVKFAEEVMALQEQPHPIYETAVSQENLESKISSYDVCDFVGFTKPFVCVYCGIEFADEFCFRLHQSKHGNKSYLYGNCKRKFELKVHLEKIDISHFNKAGKSKSLQLNVGLGFSHQKEMENHDQTLCYNVEVKDCPICRQFGLDCECIKKSKVINTEHMANEFCTTIFDWNLCNNENERIRKKRVQNDIENKSGITKHDEKEQGISVKKFFSSNKADKKTFEIHKYIEKQYPHKTKQINRKALRRCSRYFSRRTFGCSICECVFIRESQLKKHMSFHNLLKHNNHNEGSSNSKGDVSCHQVAKGKNYFHLRGSYHCKKCGKSFSQIKGMHQHQISHSLFLPFKCLECTKRFKYSASVKRHAEVFHPHMKSVNGKLFCVVNDGN